LRKGEQVRNRKPTTIYKHQAAITNNRIISSNSEVLALLSPLNGGNVNAVQVSELGNSASLSVPDIDERSQSNSEEVILGPVKQVKVVVIKHIGGIEDALGVLADMTGGLNLNLGSGGDVLGVKDTESVLVGLRLRGLSLEGENLALRSREKRGGQSILEKLLGGGRNSRGLVLVGKVVVGPLEVHVDASGDEAVSAKGTTGCGASVVHFCVIEG
jgi:hypothetical protein